jgi:2'-5' RNA ligase
MLPTADWPAVEQFRDHWTWRPDWTPGRPRLLWYLTFPDVPDLRAAAAPSTETLRATGADVVPPAWWHLTLTDIGFHAELDDWTVRASCEEVRRRLSAAAPLELTLGPLAVLPGAVVLPANPAEPLRALRDTVRDVGAEHGIRPPDDIDGHYWPHVSLCYVNADSDHEQLWEAVRSAPPRTVQVRCDRLTQVQVTRADGHYRWEVVDEVVLRGDTEAIGHAH